MFTSITVVEVPPSESTALNVMVSGPVSPKFGVYETVELPVSIEATPFDGCTAIEYVIAWPSASIALYEMLTGIVSFRDVAIV